MTSALLWCLQLFEGRQPFEGMDPIKAAALAASKGLRPEFQNKRVPAKVKELIQELWDPIAQRRPNFMEVLVRFDAMDRGRSLKAPGVRVARQSETSPGIDGKKATCACVIA